MFIDRKLATALICGSVLALTPGISSAQAVIVGDFPQPGWNNLGNNPAVGMGALAAYDAGGFLDDNATRRGFVGTDGGLLILNLTGTANENGNANRDRFRAGFTSQQSFTLNARSDISMPTFFNGGITYLNNLGLGFIGNTNFATGTVSGRLQLQSDAGVAGTFVNVFDSDANAADRLRLGPSSAQTSFLGSFVDRFSNYSVANVPFQTAGPGARVIQYRMIANLTIEGEADAGFARNSAVNSEVRIDFDTDLARGMFTSVSAVPTGLNLNSRDAVNAAAARNAFGVDGSFTKIGIVEPGRVISAHETFGARVQQLNPANIAGGTGVDGRNEHTTAVASIAAGGTGNSGQLGIAPLAQIVSSPSLGIGLLQAITDAQAAGARVINISAGLIGAAPTAPTALSNSIDTLLNTNNRLTIVKSAGNRSGQNNNDTGPGAGNSNVTDPGLSYNSITVGAVNRDFTRRADFSSFNNGRANTPQKPDIVAPGEYITAAIPADLNGDGNSNNDFARSFSGSDYRYNASTVASGALTRSSTTGDVAGTSFAAPHVAGAVALMQDYRDRHRGDTHDLNSDDNRVIKAALLNGARTQGLRHRDGTLWNQGFSPVASGVPTVTRSLDNELGAGLLDTYRALQIYSQPEARNDDNNTDQNFKITPQTAPASNLQLSWDRESVNQATGMGLENAGTVDYLLSDLGAGTEVKATLCFNYVPATGFLPQLELRFYAEGPSDFNMPGFIPNPGLEDEDVLLFQTFSTTGNVKQFTFNVPNIGTSGNGFYLQVLNLSQMGGAVTYGLAFAVPAPGVAGLMTLMGLYAARRRRPASPA